MKRTLSYTGALASLGFLAASAVINYTFGYRMGRSTIEQQTLAIVAVLAVAMNALAPFYIQWARNRAERAAAALIWILCVTYTIASAVGFAAENRSATTGARAAQHDNLQTTQDMLADELAKKKRDAKRITELRKQIIAYRDKGAAVEPDSQADAIASLTSLSNRTVRTALVILFALLIEIGAALGLYASISHLAAPAQITVPAATPAPKAKSGKRW